MLYRIEALGRVETDAGQPRGADAAADPVNLVGLSPAQLEAMRSRGTPQPFGTVTQPLERPEPRPAVRRR